MPLVCTLLSSIEGAREHVNCAHPMCGLRWLLRRTGGGQRARLVTVTSSTWALEIVCIALQTGTALGGRESGMASGTATICAIGVLGAAQGDLSCVTGRVS